jgi:hypothetical protein
MKTTFTPLVPADLAVARPHVASWPMNGSASGMSASVRRIDAAAATATSTSAGTSFTRKDAAGFEAFEDPL